MRSCLRPRLLGHEFVSLRIGGHDENLHHWADSTVAAKSFAVTSPSVAFMILAIASQDGIETPRFIRLTCAWERPAVAPNAASVILLFLRYCSSVMSRIMHGMHMHVKHRMHGMLFIRKMGGCKL